MICFHVLLSHKVDLMWLFWHWSTEKDLWMSNESLSLCPSPIKWLVKHTVSVLYAQCLQSEPLKLVLQSCWRSLGGLPHKSLTFLKSACCRQIYSCTILCSFLNDLTVGVKTVLCPESLFWLTNSWTFQVQVCNQLMSLTIHTGELHLTNYVTKTN